MGVSPHSSIFSTFRQWHS